MNQKTATAYKQLQRRVRKVIDLEGDFSLFALAREQNGKKNFVTDFGQNVANTQLVPLYEEPGQEVIWNVQRHKFWPEAINELARLHEERQFAYATLASPARIMLSDSRAVIRKGVYAIIDSGSEAHELIMLLERKRWRGIVVSKPIQNKSVSSILG